MFEFLLIEKRTQFKLSQISGEEAEGCWDIRMSQRTEDSFGLQWQTKEFDRPLKSHVSSQVRESGFNKFLRVEGTVPVSAGGNWLRQNHARCVDCLENPMEIDTTGDFPNEDRSNPLGTELLMDAEEIDFHNLNISDMDKLQCKSDQDKNSILKQVTGSLKAPQLQY